VQERHKAVRLVYLSALAIVPIWNEAEQRGTTGESIVNESIASELSQNMSRALYYESEPARIIW
jgi:hypothetical protein